MDTKAQEVVLPWNLRDELLEALQQIARANEFDVSRGRQCAEEMRQIAKTAIAKVIGPIHSDSEGGHCD